MALLIQRWISVRAPGMDRDLYELSLLAISNLNIGWGFKKGTFNVFNMPYLNEVAWFLRMLLVHPYFKNANGIEVIEELRDVLLKPTPQFLLSIIMLRVFEHDLTFWDIMNDIRLNPAYINHTRMYNGRLRQVFMSSHFVNTFSFLKFIQDRPDSLNTPFMVQIKGSAVATDSYGFFKNEVVIAYISELQSRYEIAASVTQPAEPAQEESEAIIFDWELATWVDMTVF